MHSQQLFLKFEHDFSPFQSNCIEFLDSNGFIDNFQRFLNEFELNFEINVKKLLV